MEERKKEEKEFKKKKGKTERKITGDAAVREKKQRQCIFTSSYFTRNSYKSLTNFRHAKLHPFPVLRGFSYLWQKFSKKIQTESISSHSMDRKS